MKVFLAATTGGSLRKDTREIFIKKGKPKYLLETFFSGEKNCETVLNDVGVDNFLLDSGAFSFMSGAPCNKDMIWEYAERYANFITKNQIKYYFELDVDTIFGIEFVEDIRAMLEHRTNIPCIPVWHKGRGIEYWKRMVASYKYIAIGGLVFHVKQSEWPLIKQLVDYAYKNRIKVHGLGFTKTKLLPTWNFYSVDSATWIRGAVLGSQIYYFTGDGIKKNKIDNHGKKIKLEELKLHNGIEWCKYQRYMDQKEFL